MHDGNDTKDNLRMGSRISGAGLIKMWMFVRITAGTIQQKQINQINMQLSTFKSDKNSTYMDEAGTCLPGSLNGKVNYQKNNN